VTRYGISKILKELDDGSFSKIENSGGDRLILFGGAALLAANPAAALSDAHNGARYAGNYGYPNYYGGNAYWGGPYYNNYYGGPYYNNPVGGVIGYVGTIGNDVLSPITGSVYVNPGFGPCRVVHHPIHDVYGRIVGFQPVNACRWYGEFP
jgi:hypothetical protein